jgi:hypothetical protein
VLNDDTIGRGLIGQYGGVLIARGYGISSIVERCISDNRRLRSLQCTLNFLLADGVEMFWRERFKRGFHAQRPAKAVLEAAATVIDKRPCANS